MGTHCDIGAFESQGFTLTKTSGDYQRAVAGTPFTNPLVVTVTPSAAGAADHEPVTGGVVIFTAIPNAGASATLTSSPATITSGQASVTARANMTAESYSVTASAAGAASVTFSLMNSAPTITLSPTTLPGGVKGVAYPPTTITAAGGTAAYAFTVTMGTLPTGLTLSLSGMQQYTLTVTAAPLTSIALTPPSGAGNPPSIKVGQTEQFTATGTYADGSMQNVTTQAQWSSSNPHVATGEATGTVRGESPGTVTLTASPSGVTQTITVTVGGPTPVGITVQPAPAARPVGGTSVPGSVPTLASAPRASGGAAAPAAATSGPPPAPIPAGR